LKVTDDGKKKAAVGKREPFTGRKAFYFAVTKKETINLKFYQL
jgi:hypothetical protein